MNYDSKNSIPKHVLDVVETLHSKGFEAYLVGGCVRDLLRERKPKDWDITTNATPDEIIALFSETFYENEYGTVGVVVKMENVPHETPSTQKSEVPHETDKKEVIEVTPYRLEAKYTNSRHPDSVTFSKNIEDDLKRRDFTMNALAYDPYKSHIIDPYGGEKDIKDKRIRAVGDADDRFSEDALRILRAIRLSTELGFAIESETQEAIVRSANTLKKISVERVRDEFIRMIMSENPAPGFVIAQKLDVLKQFLPELERGIGIEQNGDHIYHVWEHNIRALDHAARRDWPLHIRLAALFHDISKPETRRWSDEKRDWTFYGHDVVGGRVARTIMERLKFPKKTTETVAKLVRYHLFFTDIDKITLSAVRRLVAGVGKENVWDLMKIRACDRIGMGRPKEKPYRLRKYEAMIEEAMRAPVSVGMLKINGNMIIDVTRETPGPKIGRVLHALLEEVLDDPSKNTEKYLTDRAIELLKLPDSQLQALAEKGKEKKDEKEAEEVSHIRKRHHVE